jgi:mannan endo-1,4-beta-mannosidase
MPSLIQEASTFAIDEQVYGDDLSRAGDDVQEEFSGPMLGNRTSIESHRALQTTRWRTLNYLYSIRGSGTVAGMHERYSQTPSRFTEQARQVSGKYPGLWSGDFLFDDNRRYRQNMIEEAKRRWNSGTMINIMYHSCNPVTANIGEECWWDDRVKGPRSTMSNSKWQEIITDGSVLNRKWKQWLDEIAVYLQDLKNSGVEVLFRPFHEMNQGVFWWGGRPGPSGTRRLYQISHDYLTNVKGLDNLIWVWNIQDFGSLSNDAQNYNPGPNYFEVASLDVYEGFQTWKYDVMRNVANGKPIAIGECASLPDASRLVAEPLWTFFMSWSELTFQQNNDDKIRSVYNQAITRDEMGAWQSGTIPPPTATPPTPTPPTTGSLGDWAQCSSNSQCRNGCCSGMYSGGVLKCTPLSGGFNPNICMAGSGPTPAPPPPTPTPPTTGSLGDWAQCSRNSQCRNGCCSGRYSGGVLKCTPLSGGVFNPSICTAV